MIVAIGNDHAGLPLKARMLKVLEDGGHTVINCGTDSPESADYPDFARHVAGQILAGKAERGVLLCGSGVGVTVAANKFRGIRAGTCHDSYSAHQGVEHDDMNVLCLGSRIIGEELAADILARFLSARFTGEERHTRRLNKVLEIERETLGEAP